MDGSAGLQVSGARHPPSRGVTEQSVITNQPFTFVNCFDLPELSRTVLADCRAPVRESGREIRVGRKRNG
jgi:hypothetical protein